MAGYANVEAAYANAVAAGGAKYTALDQGPGRGAYWQPSPPVPRQHIYYGAERRAEYAAENAAAAVGSALSPTSVRALGCSPVPCLPPATAAVAQADAAAARMASLSPQACAGSPMMQAALAHHAVGTTIHSPVLPTHPASPLLRY